MLFSERNILSDCLTIVSPFYQVYYNGVFDCFSKIARHEGVLAVYKGIIPPILAETPKRATKFVCFEQYKTALQKILGYDKATPLVCEYKMQNALSDFMCSNVCPT